MNIVINKYVGIIKLISKKYYKKRGTPCAPREGNTELNKLVMLKLIVHPAFLNQKRVLLSFIISEYYFHF